LRSARSTHGSTHAHGVGSSVGGRSRGRSTGHGRLSVDSSADGNSILSHWDISREVGCSEGRGVGNSNDSLSPSSTSSSHRVGAVIRVLVHVDGSSDDVVGSIQGDVVVGVLVQRDASSIV